MMSKQSLFNFGIYKSILKRFIWGGAAYFILLFLSMGFRILLKDVSVWQRMYNGYRTNLILTSSFNSLPSFVSCFAPVVCVLLVFRFLHSKGQNIFTHSLPVTRLCNYISSLLGGLTLLVVPILLNGLILALLSVFGYGKVILLTDCGVWVLAHIAAVLVVFSVAVLSAIITGNSFGAAGMFAFLNFLPVIIAFSIYSVGEIFVFGYYGDDHMSFAMECVPIVRGYEWLLQPMNILKDTAIIYILLGISVIFLVSSALLYLLRKGERAGDISAFPVMNPFIKYLLSFVAGIMFMTALVSSGSKFSIWLIILSTAIFTIIVYFVCEMILRKEFKVFKKSYRGCIAFIAVSAVLLGTVYFTNGFGYSDYIPDKSNIKSASVLSHLSDENPVSEYPDAISYVMDTHKNFIFDRQPILREKNTNGFSAFCILYELDNGKTVIRKYYRNYKEIEQYSKKLYEYEDFKHSYNPMFSINPDDIAVLHISGNEPYTNYEYTQIADKDDVKEFMDIYISELETLSFEELYSMSDYDCCGHVEIQRNATDKAGATYFNYVRENIHKKCVNSIKWIENYLEEHKK